MHEALLESPAGLRDLLEGEPRSQGFTKNLFVQKFNDGLITQLIGLE
jgi:hypothetical protein